MDGVKEIKAILETLVGNSFKAANEKKEEKAENEDKRKLIDEIGGILKGKVDEEIWRTVVGKLEKVAYEPSETDKADNEEEEKEEAKNKAKCKNEEEEKEEKEVEYKDFKKEIEKEAEEEEAKNKKAKNSLEANRKIFFEGKVENKSKFMSQKDGINLGKELY